jgi:hypothetical protein
MITYEDFNGNTIAVISDAKIESVQDAFDIMAEVSYAGCGSIIVQKDMLPESFFSLKTGLAGEILQKFSNYRVKLAIVGDFDNVKSGSLKSFIYESNKGNQVFFMKTKAEVLKALVSN